MFCIAPFTHLVVLPDGTAQGCLCGWPTLPLGNVLESNLVDLWDGANAEKLRASVSDGSFRHCAPCPLLPGPGGLVMEGQPGSISWNRIEVLKLDYDQTCNLTCPSCRSRHSSTWVDGAKIAKIHEAVVKSGILERSNKVYVTGAGDPLTPTSIYWEFLRTLPTLVPGNPPSVILHTNGLLLDSKRWDLLGDTRRLVCQINVSLDAATPETYQTNRGGSWTKLIDNLRFASDLKRDLVLFFVVQANNYREFPEFVALANDLGATGAELLGLQNWGTYESEDYKFRAVYVKTHPQYQDFQATLNKAVLFDRRGILKPFLMIG